MPDHEHPLGKLDRSVVDSVADADILIHDAQFSRAELREGKAGWGHSAWEDAVSCAQAARVASLYLFHHAPEATDDQLNERQFMAQQEFANTYVAREGLKVPVGQL